MSPSTRLQPPLPRLCSLLQLLLLLHQQTCPPLVNGLETPSFSPTVALLSPSRRPFLSRPACPISASLAHCRWPSSPPTLAECSVTASPCPASVVQFSLGPSGGSRRSARHALPPCTLPSPGPHPLGGCLSPLLLTPPCHHHSFLQRALGPAPQGCPLCLGTSAPKPTITGLHARVSGSLLNVSPPTHVLIESGHNNVMKVGAIIIPSLQMGY